MDAVIAVAALVAVVWVGVVFVRGGLLGGCLAVLLTGSVFGHPFFNLSVEPVPLTADRVLWLALLGQYVIWRRMGWADAKPLGRAELALCGFMGLLLLSTMAHDWRVDGAQPLARLLFFFLMPAGVYWIARQSTLQERGILAVFAFLTAFGAYLALTALAERSQLDWAVFPRYISSEENLGFLGRARGPFLNPVGVGFWLGACLTATMMWWPRLPKAGKMLLVAMLVLFGLGMVSTMTRTVWLGAGGGLLVMAGLTIRRSWRVPMVGGAVLIAALCVGTQWERIVSFKRDRHLTAQETADSVKLRPILATVAWKMFVDRPVLGCGFGQYGEVSTHYLSDRSTAMPLERARPFVQHNVFLALLTETGLLGMGLFAAVLVFWTQDAWRLWCCRSAPSWARQQGLLFLALMGVYLPNAMFHDVSLIPMANMLLFFLAGVTAGLRPLAQPQATYCAAPRAELPRGFRPEASPHPNA